LYDVSLFLPLTPYIAPHHLYLSENSSVCRIPYFWEDDEEMLIPECSFSFADEKFHVEGIKIFNFHPIHISLNSRSMENYYSMKTKFNISDCMAHDLENFKNNTSQGTGTFFRALIAFIGNSEDNHGCTISELAEKWSGI